MNLPVFMRTVLNYRSERALSLFGCRRNRRTGLSPERRQRKVQAARCRASPTKRKEFTRVNLSMSRKYMGTSAARW